VEGGIRKVENASKCVSKVTGYTDTLRPGRSSGQGPCHNDHNNSFTG